MMEQVRALVTGGTGAVGQALVPYLLSENYQVRVLSRSVPPPGTFPPAVEVIQGDIRNEDALARATDSSNVVFHLAAKLHINNPDPSLEREYHAINVEGTRRLLERSASAGVKRFVFFSSISVYGPSHPGEIFSEEDLPSPDTIYARTKHEAEQAVLRTVHCESGEPIGVVLRLAAVYGKGMKGNYPRLVLSIQKRRFLSIGDGSNRRTLVHQDDVVRAALLAAEHPDATGKVYNITDGDVHRLKDILNAISEAVGSSLPPVSLPPALVRLGLGCIEDICKVASVTPPLGRFTLEKYMEDIAVDGTKAQRELNFQPQVTLEKGWKETIESWTTAR